MRPRSELEPHRNQLQPIRGAAPPARGANSSSVELTNTRTRWSGVRIGTSIKFPQRPDAYDRRLGQSRPSTPYTGGRGLIEIQFGNIWYQRPPHCVSVFPGGLANPAAALQQKGSLRHIRGGGLGGIVRTGAVWLQHVPLFGRAPELVDIPAGREATSGAADGLTTSSHRRISPRTRPGMRWPPLATAGCSPGWRRSCAWRVFLSSVGKLT